MDLFNRGSPLGLRFLSLIALSLFLMLLDYKGIQLAYLRSSLSLVTSPLQFAVHEPAAFMTWLNESVDTYKNLLQENTHLQDQNRLLLGSMQQYLALEKENETLRHMLKSAPRSSNTLQAVDVLSVDSNPFVHQFQLAAGSREGVHQGQAVIDAKGVLGQVIHVTPFTSDVLALSDNRSAIPVEDSRNGVRGIVEGRGSLAHFTLVHIPKTEDVQAGDILLTSGLGSVFPQGYPVGVVDKVSLSPGDHFAHISVIPSTQYNHSRLVLLLWPKTVGTSHDQ